MSQLASFSGAPHEPGLRSHPLKHSPLGARTALLRHGRADRPVPPWTPRLCADGPTVPLVHGRQLRTEEIRFRRLVTAREISAVLPLRREINLPLAGDPGFAALEKKETSAASSAVSSGKARSSARSGSCRWDTASRPAKPSWRAMGSRRNCCRTGGK